MIPKLHAKGSSFKGAAQYLLHDKERAQSSERVAWTETHNLAVDDPEIAWRIMAATAMDQERLKQQAGVKNTGRKSDKHVLHFTLSWHPDQTPTREQMSQAANEAIKALGASDRQAMIIAHDDEKHAHLHVMLNRVSPDDGRHLSSSKEKLKLSEWAQDYEERTGIFCENRIINNSMRKDGEYVRGQKDKARHICEDQQGAAANDNDRTEAVADEQRKKDAALAQRSRNQAEMHKRAQAQLLQAHNERKAALARDLARRINAKRNETREAYRPKWQELNQHQRSERETFDELERSFFGRASNMVKTVEISGRDLGGDRSNVISRSFRILTNAGARREYFEQAQEAARNALQREQAQQAQQAVEDLRAAQERKYAENRAQFFAEREKLAQAQQAQHDQLQQDWKNRTAERRAAFASVPPKSPERKVPDSVRSGYQRAFDSAQAVRSAQEQSNTREEDRGRSEGEAGGSGEAGREQGRQQARVPQQRAQNPRDRGGGGRDRGR